MRSAWSIGSSAAPAPMDLSKRRRENRRSRFIISSSGGSGCGVGRRTVGMASVTKGAHLAPIAVSVTKKSSPTSAYTALASARGSLMRQPGGPSLDCRVDAVTSWRCNVERHGSDPTLRDRRSSASLALPAPLRARRRRRASRCPAGRTIARTRTTAADRPGRAIRLGERIPSRRRSGHRRTVPAVRGGQRGRVDPGGGLGQTRAPRTAGRVCRQRRQRLRTWMGSRGHHRSSRRPRPTGWPG